MQGCPGRTPKGQHLQGAIGWPVPKSHWHFWWHLIDLACLCKCKMMALMRFRLDMMENFLLERVLKLWERLPRAVVGSASLEMFKNTQVWPLTLLLLASRGLCADHKWDGTAVERALSCFVFQHQSHCMVVAVGGCRRLASRAADEEFGVSTRFVGFLTNHTGRGRVDSGSG